MSEENRILKDRVSKQLSDYGQRLRRAHSEVDIFRGKATVEIGKAEKKIDELKKDKENIWNEYISLFQQLDYLRDENASVRVKLQHAEQALDTVLEDKACPDQVRVDMEPGINLRPQ